MKSTCLKLSALICVAACGILTACGGGQSYEEPKTFVVRLVSRPSDSALTAAQTAEREVDLLHAAGVDTAKNARCWIWVDLQEPATFYVKLDVGVDQLAVARRYGYVPVVEFYFAKFSDVPCSSL